MRAILRVLIAATLIVAVAANSLFAQQADSAATSPAAPAIRQSLAETAGKAAEALDTPEGKFLDQLIMNGLPSVYGEVLGNMQSSAGAQFTAEAWKGGQVAKNLATSCRWMDTMNKLNTCLGRAAAFVDIGSKVAAGDNKEAAISGVITILGELGNIPGGQAIMNATGATPPIISAAVLAFVVWRESSKQLEEATKSVAAESMYYSIERMCKVTGGRKLGEGDPIPVSSENTDKVWNRIITDSAFRGAFANYVKDELGQEFPEPGWFDTVNEYIYGAGATISGAGTSPKGGFAKAGATGKYEESTVQDRLDEQTVKSLQERKAEFKPYIAGLLGYMNRAAKTQERGVIAMKVAQALSGDLDRGSKTLQDGIGRVMVAAGQLGVATAYANRCQADIRKAVDEKDYQSLLVHKKMITDYVKNVIAWIPTTGPLAAERSSTYDKMKSGYDAACKGLAEIVAEVRKKIEKPELPKEAQGAQVAVSPESLYQEYMVKKLQQPFDWAGTAGPEAVKSNFISLMKAKKRSALQRVVSAWEKENYALALEDLSDTTIIPMPEYKDTIAGYKFRLHPTFAYPASLAGYKPQEEAQKAWQLALQMYNTARDMQVSLVQQEHQETLAWLKNALVEYNSLLQQMSNRSLEIRLSFPVIFPPHKSLIDTIGAAEKWLSENPGGIPVLTTPPQGSYGAFDMNVLPRDVGVKLSQQRFYTNDRLEDLVEVIDGAIAMYEKDIAKYDAALRHSQPDADTIREYIDPSFLADEWFAKLEKERSSAPKYINDLKGKRDALAPRFRQRMEEIDADMFWVKRAGVNWETFVRKLAENNISPAQTNGPQYFVPPFGKLPESGSSAAVLALPQIHLLTDAEKGKALSELQGFYQSSNIRGFVDGCAKYLKDDFDTFFKAIQSAKMHPEENFFIPCNNYAYKGRKFLTSKTAGVSAPMSQREYGLVTASSLAAAKAIVTAAVPGSDKFMEAVEKFKLEVPLMVWMDGIHAGDPGNQPNWGTSTVGPAYMALVGELNKKIKEHGTAISDRDAKAREENNRQAMQKLPGLLSEMERLWSKGNSLVQSGRQVSADSMSDIQKMLTQVRDFRSKDLNAPSCTEFHSLTSCLTDPKSSLFIRAYGLLEKFGKLSGELINLENELADKLNSSTQKTNKSVTDFYQAFKEAYQSRNESLVMSMLDDGWTAGDGTTLQDLQEHFHNMFTVYDSLDYRITGIVVEQSEKDRYKVKYELLITGRIFDMDIKREEKSSVVEEVRIVPNGKAKITKTFDGRFWYVK